MQGDSNTSVQEDKKARGGSICNANIISSCSMHFMASINVCVSTCLPSPPLSSLVVTSYLSVLCLAVRPLLLSAGSAL